VSQSNVYRQLRENTTTEQLHARLLSIFEQLDLHADVADDFELCLKQFVG
jgi:hypothetical protein